MARDIKTLRTVAELQAAGLVAVDEVARLEPVAARYAVAITPAMAALIDRADPDDPDRAPVRARSRASSTAAPEERADPIGDDAHEPRRRASSTATPTACC